MIEKKEQYHSGLLLGLDLCSVILALPLAYYSRLYLYATFSEVVDALVHPVLHPMYAYFWLYTVSIPIIVLSFHYNQRLKPVYRFRNLFKHLLVLGEQMLIIAFITGFISFLLRLEVSRTLVMLYLAIAFTIMVLIRIGFILTHKGARNGYRRILLVGNTPKIFVLGKKMSQYADRGYTIVGYVTDIRLDDQLTSEKFLGTTDDFQEILANHVIDQVVFINSEKNDLKIFEEIMLLCEEQGVLTRLSLDFFPHAISRTSLDFIENQPFLTFSPVPEQAFALMIKRIIDILGSVVGMAVSMPFYLITPILIKLSSKGPVVYSQQRCGLYGRLFTLYKFRSMIDGAQDILWEIKDLNEMNGPTFKMRNDPRVTSLGKILRKTSVDELPQFYNVFKGDMSLVGPRAPLPEEVAEYTPWQKRRLSVKPGITCLWQISGRSEIDFHEWMKLDLEYIDNWSLWLDFKILMMTIPTVLFGRGAR